ncbi:MAG: SDR family oxidoreductase [Pseudomonadota bacterium]
MKILVTGATGFVGRALCRRLHADNHELEIVTRGATPVMPGVSASYSVGDFSACPDFREALQDVEVVLHLAARGHILTGECSDELAAFRAVNTFASLALGKQCAAAGVRRFIFLSSIKANGESTRPGQRFSHADSPTPLTPYGLSKLEAENGLRRLSDETGMELVIVRPPLVYGSGVAANFRTMMNCVYNRVPLPLAWVTHNRRSLIGIDNLVDLLAVCIEHPAAANQIFIPSDGEDLSTAELLRRLGCAMNRPARLLPCPVWVLKLALTLFGKGDMAQRLLSSLQVDSSHALNVLGWSPKVSVDEGLRRAAESFIRDSKRGREVVDAV